MTEDSRRPPFDDDETPGTDDDLALWFEGASGVDPDTPDPGCQHDWRNLAFVEPDEGLVCTRCDRVWAVDNDDARDAMLSLWHSTRRGLLQLQQTQDKLVVLVEALTGKVRCHWCDDWDDAERLVTIDRRRACPEHLGSLLGSVVPVDDDEIEHAFDWLCSQLRERPGDLYAYWLADKAALECPDLDDGPLDGFALGHAVVATRSPWREVLRLGDEATVNDVIAAVARLLELPRPASRPGRNLLLGVLARTEWALHPGSVLSDELLPAVLLDAAPSNNRDRATVVLDLFRHEMPVDGTVSGDMADDLVEALVHRAAAELAPVFR